MTNRLKRLLHKALQQIPAVNSKHFMQLLNFRSQAVDVVIEKVYFKYSHKKYVAQFSPMRPEEKKLWAISLKTGDAYYLGKVTNGKLEEHDYRELRKFQDWSLMKGAERLWWHFR